MKKKTVIIILSCLVVLGVIAAFQFIGSGNSDTPNPQQTQQTPEPEQLKMEAVEVDEEVGIIENVGILEEEEAEQDIEIEVLEGQALYDLFQYIYDDFAGTRRHVDTLDSELAVLGRYDLGENKRLPDDYIDQYKSWRPVEEVKQAEQPHTSTTGQGSSTTPSTPSGGGNTNTGNTNTGNTNTGSTGGGSTNTQPTTPSQPTPQPSPQDPGTGNKNPYISDPEAEGILPQGWSTWTQEQKDAYNREGMDIAMERARQNGITVGG